MAEISASPIPPGPELSEVPFDFLPLGSLLPALPFLMQVYSGFVSPSLTQKSGLSARGTRGRSPTTGRAGRQRISLHAMRPIFAMRRVFTTTSPVVVTDASMDSGKGRP
jgi:hypothetical protein